MKLIIDIREEKYRHITEMPNVYGSEICEVIRNGTPYEDRPQGEWEKCSLGFDCNKCGYTQIYEDIIGEYHFCPNCGADMRKGTT